MDKTSEAKPTALASATLGSAASASSIAMLRVTPKQRILARRAARILMHLSVPAIRDP